LRTHCQGMPRMAGLFLFALCIPAWASNSYGFSTTLTLDPALVQTVAGSPQYFEILSGTPTFVVQAGDTISGTIDFANGPVSITGTGFNPFLDLTFDTDSVDDQVSGTGSVTLLNLIVSPGTSLPNMSSNGGGTQFNAGFSPSGSPANFSFTGFDYVITIDATFQGADSGPIPLTPSFFSMQGDTLTFATPVPEPVSGAICAAGCVLLGWLRSNKRRQS